MMSNSPIAAHRKADNATAATNTTTIPERIFLYDGECGLCDRTVNFLLRVDRHAAFAFAPLQGETAEVLRQRHPDIPRNLDTVVYIENGVVYTRSRAFTQSARHLPRPWSFGRWLGVIPRPVADLVYRLVARIRYRVFGRVDACRMPSRAERARLLP